MILILAGELCTDSKDKDVFESSDLKKDETHPQNKMWAIRNGYKSLSEK